METVRHTGPQRSATRTVRWALVPMPTLLSTAPPASTTVSPSTREPVRSSPPGTLRCARAMSVASDLAAALPAAAVVALRAVLVVEAQLLVQLPDLAAEAALLLQLPHLE